MSGGTTSKLQARGGIPRSLLVVVVAPIRLNQVPRLIRSRGGAVLPETQVMFSWSKHRSIRLWHRNNQAYTGTSVQTPNKKSRNTERIVSRPPSPTTVSIIRNPQQLSIANSSAPVQQGQGRAHIVPSCATGSWQRRCARTAGQRWARPSLASTPALANAQPRPTA